MIGGVCGMFAAMFSLVFGGLIAVFHVPVGTDIIYFEWGGLVFSVIIILLGAIAVCLCRHVGVALVASSILGAACGGVAVAMCLAVAAIGGILVIVANHREAHIPVVKSGA
jgi:hypothetical protein